jgi:branched-chain amino acid transport system permease protein
MLSESTLTFIALGGIFAYSFYAVLVAGQLSLGQAGFASLAAFTAVHFAPDPTAVGDVPALIMAAVIGMAVGATAALILGLPTMHLRGVYLAIATLGFAEAVRVVMLNADWTGGALGTSVPKTVTPAMAWLALLLVAYWFWRQGPSRYGRALQAIREDELAARAMGIDVGWHRLTTFLASGAVAGLYGVLWAYFVRLIAPDDFNFTTAIDGLVTAVVGGSTVFIGPLLGSGFQTSIPELQRAVGIDAGWIRPFLASGLLLVVILFLPGGMASLIPRRLRSKAIAAEDDVSAIGSVRTPSAPMADHRVEVTGRRGELIVELNNISKDYGGVHAVRDVSLGIRSGEVIGLIGPNGAGKTTLVNIISGLVPPSSGSAVVLGTTVERAKVHQVAAAGLSRTFQHSKLFNRLSALDNVVVGAHLTTRSTFLRRLLWLPSARRDERQVLTHAARCLAQVGLADKPEVRASALSYGDQRRLEIARALASRPALLILDEPAAGMNHVEAFELSQLIRALADDGLTILLIEHNVGMVLETCDHIEVLNFGEILSSGTPQQIASDPAVIDAYLGSPVTGESPGTPSFEEQQAVSVARSASKGVIE